MFTVLFNIYCQQALYWISVQMGCVKKKKVTAVRRQCGLYFLTRPIQSTSVTNIQYISQYLRSNNIGAAYIRPLL